MLNRLNIVWKVQLLKYIKYRVIHFDFFSVNVEEKKYALISNYFIYKLILFSFSNRPLFQWTIGQFLRLQWFTFRLVNQIVRLARIDVYIYRFSLDLSRNVLISVMTCSGVSLASLVDFDRNEQQHYMQNIVRLVSSSRSRVPSCRLFFNVSLPSYTSVRKPYITRTHKHTHIRQYIEKWC